MTGQGFPRRGGASTPELGAKTYFLVRLLPKIACKWRELDRGGASVAFCELRTTLILITDLTEQNLAFDFDVYWYWGMHFKQWVQWLVDLTGHRQLQQRLLLLLRSFDRSPRLPKKLSTTAAPSVTNSDCYLHNLCHWLLNDPSESGTVSFASDVLQCTQWTC